MVNSWPARLIAFNLQEELTYYNNSYFVSSATLFFTTSLKPSP